MSKTHELCSICLENFCDEKEIHTTPCKHSFHHTCVLKWFLVSDKCPYCRTIIKKKRENNIDLRRISYDTIQLFHDHEFYYFYYEEVRKIKISDITEIETQLLRILGVHLYDKIDIIISFVTNDYNMTDTVIDLCEWMI